MSQALSALEVSDLVTLLDVVKVLQRSEMMSHIADELEVYMSELGTEGRLIRLQLDELMAGVEKEKENTIRDYRVDERRSVETIYRSLSRLSSEELLSLTNISQTLGYSGAQDELDRPLAPRGYRSLSRIPRLPASIVDKLVKHFKTLHNIKTASSRCWTKWKASARPGRRRYRRACAASPIPHSLIITCNASCNASYSSKPVARRRRITSRQVIFVKIWYL